MRRLHCIATRRDQKQKLQNDLKKFKKKNYKTEKKTKQSAAIIFANFFKYLFFFRKCFLKIKLIKFVTRARGIHTQRHTHTLAHTGMQML